MQYKPDFKIKHFACGGTFSAHWLESNGFLRKLNPWGNPRRGTVTERVHQKISRKRHSINLYMCLRAWWRSQKWHIFHSGTNVRRFLIVPQNTQFHKRKWNWTKIGLFKKVERGCTQYGLCTFAIRSLVHRTNYFSDKKIINLILNSVLKF